MFVVFLSPQAALAAAAAVPLVGIIAWFVLVWLAAAALSHLSAHQSLAANGQFILTSLPGAVLFIATVWRLYVSASLAIRWLRERIIPKS